MSRRRALLIANWTFPDDPANLPSLEGPPFDVFRMFAALTHPETGLFEPADIVTVTDGDRKLVMRATGAFFAQATGDDELLLFYAGHGFLDLSNQLWLCVRDTQIDFPAATAIDEHQLRHLGTRTAAASVVYILDCCNSGRFATRGQVDKRTLDLVDGAGQVVLASTRAQDLSADGQLGSRFTQLLTEAMMTREADIDGDGYVSALEAYEWIRRHLSGQRPTFAAKDMARLPVLSRSDLGLSHPPVVRASPPSEVAPHPPPLQPELAPIPGRRRDFVAVLAALVGGLIVLALGVKAYSNLAGGARSSTPSPPSAEASPYPGDDVVATARREIDKGNFGLAIKSLTALEDAGPDRADEHDVLERAYVGARDPHGAMREAGLWLAANAYASADPRLQEDVRNAALYRESQDDAFALLESRMGPRGIDILNDIAFGASGHQFPQAATRARFSLGLDAVRARASPALGVLLDFRDARTCDAKRALLDRARDHGDARLLVILQPYVATRGYGFLGKVDCYPCMHNDTALRDALSEIEERAH